MDRKTYSSRLLGQITASHARSAGWKGDALCVRLGNARRGWNVGSAVDGEREYFPFQIDPGEHRLCARFSTRSGPAALIKLKNVAFHSLEAKSGETYYVDLRVTGPYLGLPLT